MPKPDKIESWAFEESPCETCLHSARCRAMLLACAAFNSFAAHGGRRWRSELREPDRETFRRIFGLTGEGQLAA
jgi:hypothetical protein